MISSIDSGGLGPLRGQEAPRARQGASITQLERTGEFALSQGAAGPAGRATTTRQAPWIPLRGAITHADDEDAGELGCLVVGGSFVVELDDHQLGSDVW